MFELWRPGAKPPWNVVVTAMETVSFLCFVGKGGTVDGSEIGREPLEVGSLSIFYRVLYIPGGWPWDF